MIAAAALHAGWNGPVKHSTDKHPGTTAVVFGHVPPELAILPFVPAPAQSSWPCIVAGACLHSGYQLFLLAPYRIGDLTQVYPIARGTALSAFATGGFIASHSLIDGLGAREAGTALSF